MAESSDDSVGEARIGIMSGAPGWGWSPGMSGFAESLVASTLTEESSPVSGVTSLGSGATGAGAVRTSSMLCAPTLLAGGAEAGGMTAPDTVFTGSDVSGLGWATAVTGALDGVLLA